MENYMRICANISAAALEENIKEIKKHIGKDTMIMPVIKADAYGHGAVRTACILSPYADRFAVAVIEEAKDLREHGIKQPVMLLGHTFSQSYKDAIENDVILTVYDAKEAKSLSETARKMGKKAVVHLAVDTGMSRIGFPCTESGISDAAAVSRLPFIETEGIFTHFAAADEADKEFTHLQARRFCAFCEGLKERGVDVKIKHAANSAAVMELSEYGFNMVRPGIILYGLYPSKEVLRSTLTLKPVMELVSRVVSVRTIYKGDTVSYGRKFTAPREMRIATVHAGYADGYPRALSDKGYVLINGKKAKILGRVCMDQFMVDVDDIDNVQTGTKVTLIGKNGDKEITAEDIADITGTISYEIVCGIGKRVPRITVRE